ncbi:hypothetical protein [Nonomuraea turcica]|uniref:hypothetical protein n=1 Tax=Nonomuraea sp. G32 TaxID=3067274 RepID=UPI00273C17D1|nr:hypothetical protein [Nonomuraea sp. G32]MDP4511742.1 hypothetical protein [Nonomuraea sp. G32]
MRLRAGLWWVASVVMPVAVAVAGNQILNDGIWSGPWIAIALGLAGAGAVVAQRASRPPQAPTTLDAVAARLAGEVHRQWTAEAAWRRVQPLPLQVRWSSTGRPVAAGREVVIDDDSGAGWELLPLTGTAEEMVAAFRALPHRQLVVLGEPGAGKSVLAMLLTLGLLKEAAAGGPVPVLLPISSWNPALEPVEEFVIRCLGEDYDFLTVRDGDGPAWARGLVEAGRVLPVLDGLDELPVAAYVRAVEELDVLAAAGRPLVVTCRSEEYEQAIRTGGLVLSRAAVVEIEPVGVEEAIAFLSHPAPSRARWQPVFEHLRAQPAGVLATALSTPFMVWLARAAFQATSTDPDRLIAMTDRSEIAATLMDGFVAAEYRSRPAGPRRRYRPERAARWLGRLAYQLRETRLRDWWWWQLAVNPNPKYPNLAETGRAMAAMLVAGAGLVAAVGGFAGLRAALAACLAIGFAAAGTFHLLWPDTYPPSPRGRYRTTRADRTRRRRRAAAFGIVFGLATGFVADAWAAALIAVPAATLATIVLPWAAARTEHPTPRLTFRANHRNAALAAARHALIGGPAFALGALVIGPPGRVAAVSGAAALVYAGAAAFGAGWWTWTRFRIIHLFLAARGKLPWRLWTFVEDAHQRQMLRQAGSAWQFRHALLQDHLADAYHLDHLGGRAKLAGWRTRRELARLLSERGRIDELRARADQGDSFARSALVGLLREQGKIGEAVAILRDQADAGNLNAAYGLASLLAEQGLVSELRTRAEAGDLYAPQKLADLLEAQGRLDELRALADAGVKYAASALGRLLAATGRHEELGTRAEAGEAGAVAALAKVLAEQGRVEELRALSDAGWRMVDRLLAKALAAQDRVEEAAAVLRARADNGDPEAADQLIDMLMERGRIQTLMPILEDYAGARGSMANVATAERLVALGHVEEAITFLDARVDPSGYGVQHVAGKLADLLATQGRLDEAINVLRTRVHPLYSPNADQQVVRLLAEHGRVDELRAQSDAGNWSAAARLVSLLVERGQTEDAIEILREVIARGRMAPFLPPADRLVTLLIGTHLLDEALTLLRQRADADDPYASRELARLLGVEGHVEELRARAAAGDASAASELARILDEQGLTQELRARADAGDPYAARRLGRMT